MDLTARSLIRGKKCARTTPQNPIINSSVPYQYPGRWLRLTGASSANAPIASPAKKATTTASRLGISCPNPTANIRDQTIWYPRPHTPETKKIPYEVADIREGDIAKTRDV